MLVTTALNGFSSRSYIDVRSQPVSLLFGNFQSCEKKSEIETLESRRLCCVSDRKCRHVDNFGADNDVIFRHMYWSLYSRSYLNLFRTIYVLRTVLARRMYFSCYLCYNPETGGVQLENILCQGNCNCVHKILRSVWDIRVAFVKIHFRRPGRFPKTTNISFSDEIGTVLRNNNLYFKT